MTLLKLKIVLGTSSENGETPGGDHFVSVVQPSGSHLSPLKTQPSLKYYNFHWNDWQQKELNRVEFAQLASGIADALQILLMLIWNCISFGYIT